MSSSKRSIPFQGLTNREKQNLALAATLVFYCLFFGWQVFVSGFFIRGDYLAFWSGGYIANTQGYEQVYDIETISQLQQSLVLGNQQFSPLPVALLPIFIVPFQILSTINLANSFWLWLGINFVIYLLYLFFLCRKWNVPWLKRSLFMFALSFPFFLTLLEGQTNVWLLIFVGEFIRSHINGKPFRAGLWLGGLLLKPQTLILLLPFLLFKRDWKTTAGFSVSAIGLLLASLLLGGWQSLKALLMIWLNFAEGMPTNSPENMMNWRMLGEHLKNLNMPLLGWVVVAVGMIFTALLMVAMWRESNKTAENQDQASPKITFGWVILGTLAATCAFTWHAHLHMGLLLLPALLYLYSLGKLEDYLVNIWLFLPPATFILALLIGILMSNPSIMIAGQLGGFLLGFSGLVINMILLVVSFQKVKTIARNA